MSVGQGKFIAAHDGKRNAKLQRSLNEGRAHVAKIQDRHDADKERRRAWAAKMKAMNGRPM